MTLRNRVWQEVLDSQGVFCTPPFLRRIGAWSPVKGERADLQVSESAVWKLIFAGRLAARVGTSIRMPQDSLEKFLKQSRKRGWKVVDYHDQWTSKSYPTDRKKRPAITPCHGRA